MMFAFVSALLVIAGQQAVNVPEEQSNEMFSERQPVRLAPLPIARALSAFHDICMAHFPDPAAFDQAAAAADLGFVRTPDTGRVIHEWSSTHGQIVFRQARNPERAARRDRREGHARRQRWRERCDYWVAIEERLEPGRIAYVIGAALAPGIPPVAEVVGVSWDLPSSAPGTTLRLVYTPSIDDPRLFTLSLQRLDAAEPR